MVGFGKGVAILISIILGMVILPIFGIDGILSIVIIGFLATYLTATSQRSYNVGTAAGAILGFMIFIYGFFVAPQLPDLPSISNFEVISLTLGGLFNLLLGFILLIAVSGVFGSIGGVIAGKIRQKRSKRTGKGYKREYKGPKRLNKPRRSLNRK